VAGLLRYCARHSHWSVFEHAFVTLEVDTTRDIARQMLRHRSFSFSEFSQRYADVGTLTDEGTMQLREARLQDEKNRQNSIEIAADSPHHLEWLRDQQEVWGLAVRCYRYAIQRGVAKEQARALLPEGLTPSRLYMSGSLRSWITYCQVRLDPSTQKEHRQVAEQVLAVLRTVAPITMQAFFPEAS
jgi:thymidylate synthase (FAD)